ncbi:MAG: hypothetical protein C4288_05145 [Leptolyngbya sp. ERB_1_1]
MIELTLQLDQELLQKVRQWAESQGLSVNEAGTELLRSALNSALIRQNADSLSNVDSDLTPWTQSLVGVISSEGFDDEALQKQYLDYLEEKYQ